MATQRTCLPVGAQLQTESGSIYQICGAPMGSGGGSLVYPAHRLIPENGILRSDGFLYALKECFPASAGRLFLRAETGQILSASGSEEDQRYLLRAQQLQLAEGQVSRDIYKTASRILPIRESSRQILLTLPGKEPVSVTNTVTIMDALSEKGRCLTQWIREQGRFTPAQALRILQQLLFSLREVHHAGYLHLDIQAGNLFLRGSLEDKSELVTLIDFGSARAMENGKTAPIRDRVIFTTQGYSAPEILTKNDGSLCLGPEADLYSAGCLALYLLTGQTPDPKQLLSNHTGQYLKANQLRRIKCPRHLVPRLQALLAKALSPEPDSRYQSAEEMLADTAVLIGALQPYRSDLACVDYDAFICYRHAEADSMAAKYLQQKLENFRAPRGLSSRRRPFQRVFLDEGELSSCADFGQQIRAALKNAGWLIVVCSPATPLSPWVISEIDTFLEYHDPSRLLAVLIEGEPEESFPPRLLGAPDGSGEVLAADARGTTPARIRRKLDGDALLRLAAPMLDTTFESLKMRRRSQIFQRIALISALGLSATAAFSAYAVRQNRIIREQYRQNLISESKYLAGMAYEAYDDNDPLKAAELALRALPSETQDRPVIPTASFVLEYSLGLYRVNAGNLTANASAVGVFRHGGSLLENTFFCDFEGNRLFTCGGGKICIWDSDSYELLVTLPLERDTGIVFHPECAVKPEGRLYYGDGNRLVCYDYRQQKECWRYEDPDRNVRGILPLPESRQVAVLLDPFMEANRTLLLLDEETGRIQKEFVISFSPEINSLYNTRLTASQDETLLAFHGTTLFGEPELDEAVIVNLSAGDVTVLRPQAGFIETMTFTEDNRLLIAGATDHCSTSLTFHSSFLDTRTCLMLLDPATGEELWHYGSSFSGFYCPMKLLPDPGNGRVIFSYGNRCVLLDEDSGAQLRKFELSETVVNLSPSADGNLLVYTADGRVFLCYPQKEEWVSFQHFPDHLYRLYGSNGIFYSLSLDDPDMIRKHEYFLEDENWEVLAEDSNHPQREFTAFFVEGQRIVLYGNAEETVSILDAETGALRHFPAESSAGCPLTVEQVLGFRQIRGREQLLFVCRDDCRESSHTNSPILLLCIDPETGDREQLRIPVPEDAAGRLSFPGLSDFGIRPTIRDVLYKEGDIFFLCQNGYDSSSDAFPLRLLLYRWDLKEDSAPQLLGSCDSSDSQPLAGLYSGHSRLISAGNSVYYANEQRTDTGYRTSLFCLDGGVFRHLFTGPETSDTGNALHCPDLAVCISTEADRIALLADEEILIFSTEGAPLGVIPFPNARKEINTLYFDAQTGNLLLWSDPRQISMYDTLTGRLLESQEIPFFIENYSDSMTFRPLDSHTLLLDFGSWLALMDPSEETWGISSVIPSGIGYDPVGNVFYTWSEAEAGTHPIGRFRRYTVADMVAMGREMLGMDG